MNARRAGRRTRYQRGQGTLEFQIIAALVLLPLLMAVLQMGLLIIAKNTLNAATLVAARAGAASGGDRTAMQNALAIGLAPLFAGGKGMSDVAANYGQVMGEAMLKSKLATLVPGTITVINPTAKSFSDFGIGSGAGKVIPVIGAYDNAQVGPASRQTRADALLLKIEVRYCHEMIIPIINRIISTVSSCSFLPGNPSVPLSSQAIVRMTVPPAQANFK